jgi:hypothetical protein
MLAYEPTPGDNISCREGATSMQRLMITVIVCAAIAPACVSSGEKKDEDEAIWR